MKSCEQYREQFVDALYDELDPEVRKQFEEHLRTCASCRAEFSKMQNALSIMDKRERIEPTHQEWKAFWNVLDAKLKTQNEAGQRSRIIHWPPQLPAWAYGIAALFILAVGMYVGKMYFAEKTTVPPHDTTATAAASSPAAPPDSSTAAALAYLERSRNLLIGLANMEEEHHAALDFSHHQQASRELIDEGRVLTVALNKPDQQLMRQLIQDLQIILLQLANIEVRPGIPAIELVKKGIDEKSILLKINLEEMKAASQQNPKKYTDKKNTQHL